MIRCFSLSEIPPLPLPIHLTIGNFDGVHLGHQRLLRHLKAKGGVSVVITFSNHPSALFSPKNPTPLLCSLEERLRRIEACGIDLALALPFNEVVSALSYSNFITLIRRYIPFQSLVLGKGALFGKGRAGTPENLRALGLNVEYIPKIEGISSKQIREWIREGKEKLVRDSLYSSSKTSASG